MTNQHNRQFVTRCLAGIAMLAACISAVSAESFPATLQWAQRVELSTPVSGVIREVKVDVGERVSKGAILLQLDDEVFRSRLQSAQATHRNQEENYKEMQRELERSTELYNRTLLSDHELQQAKNSHSNAKADIERARAAAVQAKYNLQYSTIRAPFDAWVLARNAEPGKVVAAELKAETLLIVAAADRMLARTLVPESKLVNLRKGVLVKVLVAGQEITGAVKSIALEPEQKGATDAARYAVDVEFATGDKPLRAGQTATVILP